MNESPKDVVSYMVLVRGLDAAAYAPFGSRFPKARGGASLGSTPREIYRVVDCERDDVSEALAWIAEKLAGQFRVVEIGVNIQAPRNWANFDFPTQIVEAAHRWGATLKVSFMSPPTSCSPSTKAE